MSKEEQTSAIDSMMTAWVEMSKEVMTMSTETWASLFRSTDQKTHTANAAEESEGSKSSFDISKFMESVFLALAHPFVELENVSADMGNRTGCDMFRSGLEGMLRLQDDWMHLWTRWGKEAGNGKTAESSQTAFGAWLEDTENILNRFMKIPQLGPTRNFGEKLSSYWGAYQHLYVAWNEFLRLNGLPLETSFVRFQEKLEDLKENEQLPEEAEDFYTLWVNTLEKEFMQCMESPEYRRVLHRTLEAGEEFYAVQQELGQDMLTYLPVASQQEVDELAEENYQLKKTLKMLAKKVAALEAQSV
jgi:hypothetical protein